MNGGEYVLAGGLYTESMEQGQTDRSDRELNIYMYGICHYLHPSRHVTSPVFVGMQKPVERCAKISLVSIGVSRRPPPQYPTPAPELNVSLSPPLDYCH